MIVKEFYKKRADGVRLYRRIDAVVNENNEPVRDEKGQLIPTGFMIQQVETGVLYSEAIDVQNAPYTYVETDIAIEVVE